MARYIDIEAVGIGKAKREAFLVPEYADGWNNAIEIFENEPTADVVEVVRCRACKLRETSDCPMYREEYSEWDDDGYTEVDFIVTDLTEDEGFCHCGAKMDGGNNEA